MQWNQTDWKNTHRRFCRWPDRTTDKQLIGDPDFEWLMIDASHYKVYPHTAGVHRDNQGITRAKGDLTPRYIWSQMHMACRSESLSQKLLGRIALNSRAHYWGPGPAPDRLQELR